ncbi:MAG: hypothetical protein WAL83_15705 [Arenicellales bacterium]
MSLPATSEARKAAGTWRRVFAAILDFIFVVGGYLIGYFSGGLTGSGIKRSGGPAFLPFAMIVLYFIIFRRYLGGTLFQRLLGAY